MTHLSKLLHQKSAQAFLRHLFWDTLGGIAYGVGVYTFASHAGFAPGGITGLGVILNYLFKAPIGTTALLLNIPIVIISLGYLGKRYLLRTLQTLIISALLMDLVMPLFPHYTGNPLLAALFGGGISGFGLALIYQAGSCTGGSDLVIMSLRKLRPHLSVGQITLMIDGSLIVLGAFVYNNIDAVLYGILFTLVSTFVIDRLMDGFAGGKMALVISQHHGQIASRIQGELNRGVTLLKGQGMYTGAQRDVLMCACARAQLPLIRRIVSDCDPETLLIVMDYNEVRGNGFLPHGE
jgi:uncharacterized membrane-anchored protein YitT (DUF2179 family)